MNRPIENCYWVVPGRFLAGEYPINIDEESSPGKIGAIIRSGVSVFIDLTEERDNLRPYDGYLDLRSIVHERFPVRDCSVPRSRRLTRAVLDTIDRCMEKKKAVYVHCMGGVGRTGVIVGCWLSRKGFRGEAALIKLQELWRQCPKSVNRISPETDEQRRYILKWTEDDAANPERFDL